MMIFLHGLGCKLGMFAVCFWGLPWGRARSCQGNGAVPIPGWRRLCPSGVIPNSSFSLFLNASSQEVFGASLGAPNHRPRDFRAAARSPCPPTFPLPGALLPNPWKPGDIGGLWTSAVLPGKATRNCFSLLDLWCEWIYKNTRSWELGLWCFCCSSLWTSLGLEEKKGPVSLLLLIFKSDTWMWWCKTAWPHSLFIWPH